MGHYYLHTIPDDEMPPGKSWMFLNQPCGDAYFVIGRNDEPVELTPEILANLLPKIVDTYDLDESQAS